MVKQVTNGKNFKIRYIDENIALCLQFDKHAFENELEEAVSDLVGPDRWHSGKPYTAIIDKFYMIDRTPNTPDTVEIKILNRYTQELLLIWLGGWKLRK